MSQALQSSGPPHCAMHLEPIQCVCNCPPVADHWYLKYMPLFGIIVTFAAFLLGLHQYLKAQRWKRNEFASTLLKALNTDADIMACCKLLDYPKRNIVLEHRRNADGKPYVLKHSGAALIEAMRVDPPAEGFREDEIAYHNTLDQMCFYLSQVAHSCKQELVFPSDVRPLSYWIEKIMYFDKVKPAHRYALAPFVLKYHPGVIELAEIFKRSGLLSICGRRALRKWTQIRAGQPPSRRTDAWSEPSCPLMKMPRFLTALRRSGKAIARLVTCPKAPKTVGKI
jgi:hypothetical protein